jgi:hypothetical protein
MQPWIKDFIIKHRDLPPVVYPPLPTGPTYKQFDWILSASGMAWLEIDDLTVPYKAMLAEAQALRPLFVEHRSSDSHGWLSLAIHGVGATITSRPEDHGLNSNEVIYDWTEIQDRCPVTVDFFKNHFPYDNYQRVRFMLLEAGGYIAPHSDNTLPSLGGAINISLNNPDDCNLVTTQGCVPFKDQGSVFLYDNHYRHAVYNNSKTDRYHIIVHGGPGPEWSKRVVTNYKRILNG